MGASFDETIAFSDDELYGAAVNVRTNGLIELIRDFADEAEISVGKNGFPCIDAIIAGVSYKMSYFPVGDVDTDRFILVIRTSAFKDDDKDDISKMLVCESYNAASVMGYAIYLPLDGSIEYRISIAERGGLSDSEYYRYVFEMAENSIEELVELLEENED
ncbi:MAG: hypothetical protein IJ054_02565 [Lachnospiraceae bacterium]|nr:hypothetical protein [Lachnospiraceae bacterium]MBQ9234779.1 hypothetical protein [Lachnospiraceae bacterium]MBQ9608722.1 hypothetical protein [Lachnospiraceae bacterium]